MVAQFLSRLLPGKRRCRIVRFRSLSLWGNAGSCRPGRRHLFRRSACPALAARSLTRPNCGSRCGSRYARRRTVSAGATGRWRIGSTSTAG